jgi:hypothetical protein
MEANEDNQREDRKGSHVARHGHDEYEDTTCWKDARSDVYVSIRHHGKHQSRIYAVARCLFGLRAVAQRLYAQLLLIQSSNAEH